MAFIVFKAVDLPRVCSRCLGHPGLVRVRFLFSPPVFLRAASLLGTFGYRLGEKRSFPLIFSLCFRSIDPSVVLDPFL